MADQDHEPRGDDDVEGSARRDSFISLLAHEIRNPLAPIRSGVALLRSGRIDERARADTLAMMERQLAHLVRLIDDLLASASVRKGGIPITAERVPLSAVLEAAIDSVRPAIEAKHQELLVTGADTAAMINVDPRRLSQALSNLLNGSSKKTQWTGRISIDVTIVGSSAVIRISDNGPPLADGNPEDVFELFTRSATAIGEGLGIGLALVRGLVEMNGGTVDVVDVGDRTRTVFEVRVPVAEQARSAPPGSSVESRPPEAWRSKRILVVDDNVDAATSLGTLLELDGHTIRLAHDGPSAVVTAREFVPDVIFMDIGLPGFSGVVATQRIRQLHLPARPVIVALTGWGSAADRESTKLAGCDLHLVKPVEYRAVSKALSLARPSA